MHFHLTTVIPHLPSETLITITGAIEQLRNWDVYFPFRQDSDFLYLTGLSVPGLVLTIHHSESGIQEPGLLHTSQWQKQEVILWREAITEMDIIWGSDKISDDELTRISGITDIRDMNELEQYREDKKEIAQDEIKSILHSLRLIKTTNEISKIRKAIAVSQEAFSHIESMMRPWVYEYEIEAEIARIFRSHHLTEAYPSIVASGPNACVLHYTAHTRQLEQGDLVLIDAGAEYMGYASDMTRTFLVTHSALGAWSQTGLVVSGFSPRQLAVYEAVERVKKVAENTLHPDISFIEYERIVRTAMNNELRVLWLIPRDASEDEIVLLSRKYYPHRTSHFLGLDVHDVGPRDAILVPGMVLTVEPGIYISNEQIGVRIEDDYMVTDTGCERLS